MLVLHSYFLKIPLRNWDFEYFSLVALQTIIINDPLLMHSRFKQNTDKKINTRHQQQKTAERQTVTIAARAVGEIDPLA